MTQARRAIEQMQATLAEIEAKVAPLPQAWFAWRPAPDVWSILDNLCHIEEFLPYWSGEILAVVTNPGREWGRTHADADRLAAVANTGMRNPASVLQSIHSHLHTMSNLLAPLDDKTLGMMAASRNPRWGTKPVSFILESLLVEHLAGHCNQIQRNIDQLKHGKDSKEER
jgi:hypothetical protein